MRADSDKFQLYRRIYRMRRQRFKPAEIATALELPIGTILKVIGQFENREFAAPTNVKSGAKKSDAAYIIPVERNQYLILDIGGPLTYKHIRPIRDEFQKILRREEKRATALRLADTNGVDSSAVGAIVSFNTDMTRKGARVLLLDPSREIDRLFKQLNIYERIPVFGTETALEQWVRDFQASEDKGKRGRLINF